MVSAIRAAAQLRLSDAVPALLRIAGDARAHANLRLEALTALGAMRAPEALPLLYDLIAADWHALRGAALQVAAQIDPDAFVFVLSSLEPDRDWRVRAALAVTLASLPPEIAVERLRAMLRDEDRRVRPAVLSALARVKAPDLDAILRAQLAEDDYVIRATAVRLLGQSRPPDAAAVITQAFDAANADASSDVRIAALSALGKLGGEAPRETLQAALQDKDWAVRLHAAGVLRGLDASADLEQAIRPAPGPPPAPYDDPQVIAPEVSPHVFIETAHGTVEFQLAVLDAPQTSRNFIELARKGYFNGLQVHRVVPNFVIQDGDPRGDGQGGPGYTIRDELNPAPYLRGTVGMALSGPDTGGSQFFITHSPAPHLDGRYTVFGRVVSGMEVVDRIRVGDVITRVRVWDGRGWM
jgi:cyclophilin family peptidyl-prolyl cis-trans isomerase